MAQQQDVPVLPVDYFRIEVPGSEGFSMPRLRLRTPPVPPAAM